MLFLPTVNFRSPASKSWCFFILSWIAALAVSTYGQATSANTQSVDSDSSLPHLVKKRKMPVQSDTVALHGTFEIAFRLTTRLRNYPIAGAVVATFQGNSGMALGQVIRVEGFWDGNGVYRIRFSPPASGEWLWSTSSAFRMLDGRKGRLLCAGALPDEHASFHGQIVAAPQSPYTFAHRDGTPFFLMGDTQWALFSQLVEWPAEFQAFIDARAKQGFNYIHAPLFSTSTAGTERNEGGPAFYHNDGESFNAGFWQSQDRRIAYLNEKGIVAGLMLGTPETWQMFSSTAQVERYVRYVIDRYAASNVIWIISQEYERAQIPGGVQFVGELLRLNDPYGHPITVHSLDTSADDFGSAPWLTVIYQQNTQPALITTDRRFAKPVINTGFGYEGQQTADEMRKDAWQITMRGGFFVYGNTRTAFHDADFSSENLNSKGAFYLTALKDFWTNNGRHEIQWWRFSKFEELGGSRWMAGSPGAEYVIYSEPSGALALNLPEQKSRYSGAWFETRAGKWRSSFAGVITPSMSFTSPGGGYAAYLAVTRDTLPPVVADLRVKLDPGEGIYTAEISWNTDEAATAQIVYGVNPNLAEVVADSNFASTHALDLQNLQPDAIYRFRITTRDELDNVGVTVDSFATGPAIHTVIDDFNRDSIGADWTFEPEYWQIKDGELALTPAATGSWRYLAVYSRVRNDDQHKILEVGHRWGRYADAGGVREGALAVMLDTNSPRASGYWIWHRYGHVWLWTVVGGRHNSGLDLGRWPGLLRDPVAGDQVTIKFRQEPEANYFDYYINGRLSATAVDSAKHYPKSNRWYNGFFRYGQNVRNETDDFTLKYAVLAGNSNGAQILAADSVRSKIVENPADVSNAAPQKYALAIHPNPISSTLHVEPTVTVRFDLTQAAQISIQVLDMVGRVVTSLSSGEFSGGQHQIGWSGRDLDGGPLASGTYFILLRYRPLSANGWSQMVRKVLVLR